MKGLQSHRPPVFRTAEVVMACCEPFGGPRRKNQEWQYFPVPRKCFGLLVVFWWSFGVSFCGSVHC